MKMKKIFAVGAAKLGMFAVALGLVGSAWGEIEGVAQVGKMKILWGLML